MAENNSKKSTLTYVIVIATIVIAILFGYKEVVKPEPTPGEKIGKAIDDMTDAAKDAAEDLEDKE